MCVYCLIEVPLADCRAGAVDPSTISQPTGHRYERGCPERALAVGFRFRTELSGHEMSSSIEGESFKIGAHVEATDGRCGHLTRVIIDPVADALTHLVVEPGHHEARARLVPLDLVAGADEDQIRLSCTKQQFEQLDEADDIEFLDADADAFGYGDNASAWPYYGIGTPLGHHPQPIFVDRVPLGEVEIRRGDAVHAKDGLIGDIEGLVIDPADRHVTHVLLQEGHFWGRKQVAIPIDTASRVGDEVRVDLTKEEIEALPEVDIRSHGPA
jgi:uncharacterized protein YrrD